MSADPEASASGSDSESARPLKKAKLKPSTPDEMSPIPPNGDGSDDGGGDEDEQLDFLEEEEGEAEDEETQELLISQEEGDGTKMEVDAPEGSTKQEGCKRIPYCFPLESMLKEIWSDYESAPVVASLSNNQDLVIFVVNDREMQAALRFITVQHLTPVSVAALEPVKAYIGIMPCLSLKGSPARVMLIKLKEAGAAESQAVLQTMFASGLRTRYVIAAGCCFGYSEEKQKLWDVAVSSVVLGYESVRVGEVLESRNELQHIPATLKGHLQDGASRFRFKLGKQQVKAHLGIVLCGNKLVDDSVFKAKLLEMLKCDAAGKISGVPVVGGEMEATGMTKASGLLKNVVQCFLVKGISDWGKNKNGDEAQEALESLKPGYYRRFEQLKATFTAFAFIAQTLEYMDNMDAIQDIFVSYSPPSRKQQLQQLKQRTEFLHDAHRLHASCVQLIKAQAAETAAEAKALSQEEVNEKALKASEGISTARKKVADLELKLKAAKDDLQTLQHKVVGDALMNVQEEWKRQRSSVEQATQQLLKQWPLTDLDVAHNLMLTVNDEEWMIQRKIEWVTSWNDKKLQGSRKVTPAEIQKFADILTRAKSDNITAVSEATTKPRRTRTAVKAAASSSASSPSISETAKAASSFAAAASSAAAAPATSAPSAGQKRKAAPKPLPQTKPPGDVWRDGIAGTPFSFWKVEGGAVSVVYKRTPRTIYKFELAAADAARFAEDPSQEWKTLATHQSTMTAY